MPDERTFGSYVLEQHLATGGMAEVFRARRVGVAGFAVPVCIKRMLPSLLDDDSFIEMFIDEARTGAQLRHGNIVGIDDFGEVDGQYFLCMEYVSGVDLARLVRHVRANGGTLPFDVAAYIAGEVLKALDYAHRKLDASGRPLEVVHRDVSPHNILLSDAGEVKLTDFGIAKAASRIHRTVGAVVKGKLAYMAPEQAAGARLDGRADLFALGVVLYEMITGRRPFDRPNQAEMITAVVKGERPAVLALRPDAPMPLVRVIDRLMATRPADRYAHGGDALLDLAEIQLGGGAARQLAALVAQCASDVPTPSRPAASIGTDPTRPAIGGATTVDPNPDELDAVATSVIGPRIGDRTEIASPPTAAFAAAQIATDVIGLPPASAAPTRTIAVDRHDADKSEHPRETSPHDRTRTTARELPAQRTAATPSRGTRILTVVAVALMILSAAALVYVLFAH